MEISKAPAVQAEMLIRRPVASVFEAIVDPAITTKFWFTRSSGPLEPGKQVRWDWQMYGVSTDVVVKELAPHERVVMEWDDGIRVDWRFSQRGADQTFLSVTETGYSGTGDEIVARALDSTGGFTMVLCALKAWLEHGIRLNVVADKAPDANIPY